jgi:hypothetical protein
VNACAAYDAARSRLVAFLGQLRSNAIVSETWEWDGSQWSLRSQGGPAKRTNTCMAYDPVRHVTVLFGGQDVTLGPAPYHTIYGDTWEWDGTTWTERQVPGPGARFGATMGYDEARQRIVLYGGFNTGVLGDTWEWDGTTWTPIPVGASPGGLGWGSMTYDATHHQLLYFGGYDGGTSYNGLWGYDGTTWTQLSTSGPAPRRSAALVYDRTRGLTVLEGGVKGNGADLSGDTWLWDGQSWTQTSDVGPGGIGFFWNGVYDEAHQAVLVLYNVSMFEILGASPSVFLTPTDLERPDGTDITLIASVDACGVTPSYQWTKDGVDLDETATFSGTQTDALTIHAAAVAQAGAYRVRIDTGGPLFTSNASTIRICLPPTITVDPADVLVPIGSPASFSVTATGPDPLTYEWRKNNVTIPGATASSFTVPAVALTDEGRYSVTVSGCGSTVLSRAAALNVAHDPVVLAEDATPTSPYVVHISWTTQDPAQATLAYGPTPSLGTLVSGGAAATSGSFDINRGSWSSFFYRLTWSGSGGVATGDIHQVVFPPFPTTLAFIPSLRTSFISFPTPASGAQLKLRITNLGPGAITGALDLTSATLGAAPARNVQGVLTTPSRLVTTLPVGTSAFVTPDLTFKRSEIGAAAGASVTFRAQATWWATPAGTGASSTQIFSQRMTLPKR